MPSAGGYKTRSRLGPCPPGACGLEKERRQAHGKLLDNVTSEDMYWRGGGSGDTVWTFIQSTAFV